MTAYPAEYGYVNDGFTFPESVDFTLNSPEAVDYSQYPRGIRGDVLQADNPSYAGVYVPGFRNDPGAWVSNSNNLNPGGSGDLATSRESAGGISTGTNRQIAAVGPVGGFTPDVWAGRRAAVHRPVYGQYGPVAGGPDHSQALAAAVYQQAQYAYSEAEAVAGMVAAV